MSGGVRAIAPVRELDEVPDEVLVARVLRGDEAAFTSLYRRHARYVAGVAYRLFGEDSELDDTVQEAFLEAVRGLAKLQDPTRFRAWLVTITVRAVQKRLGKRQRRRKLAAGVGDVMPRASDPGDRAEVDALYDALEQVPADVRVPWILHKIEGETLPEVARLCDASLSTVKRRIADAEKRIARRLDAR